MNRIIAVLLLAVFSLSNFSAEPAAGERELSATDAEAALRGISEAFKAHPNIKAKLVSEIEDLAGKRTEEGEFVLERPVRVLRKFTKPSLKIWLLDGALLSEFSSGQKTINVKDISGAPKLLKQVVGAMTGDVSALAPLYDVKIFAAKDEKEPKALRLVLDKKLDAPRRFYKSIEARIATGEKFFNEIRYIPEEGDEITEKFLEIQSTEKPAPSDFALPEGIERKVERVTEQ